MLNLKPLFPGSSEADQLKKIFKLMGTPDPEKWPGLTELCDWKAENYDQWQGEALSKICPKMDSDGLDLLDKMLRCNPAERITAKDALNHVFFKDIPDNLKKLYSN